MKTDIDTPLCYAEIYVLEYFYVSFKTTKNLLTTEKLNKNAVFAVGCSLLFKLGFVAETHTDGLGDCYYRITKAGLEHCEKIFNNPETK